MRNGYLRNPHEFDRWLQAMAVAALFDGAGRNSPFTGALIRHLSSSNEEIMGLLRDVRNDVLRETQRQQRPWESSGLTERFYFKGPQAEKERVAAAKAEEERRKQAEAEAPARYSALMSQARTELENGDNDKVIAIASEAIRLDPNISTAFHNRGIAYSNKGDFDRAIADYNEAIRLDPNNAYVLYWRGKAKQMKGDASGGAADISKAKQLDPSIGR